MTRNRPSRSHGAERKARKAARAARQAAARKARQSIVQRWVRRNRG